MAKTNLCCSNFDRISNLPGNVLENILRHLPLKEAGRTSILSKKLRHRWADVPQLVFDNTFLCSSQKSQNSQSYKLLMMNIYEVLLLHTGPIHKFTLSLSGLKSCPEIDRLILFQSTKGIQDFGLRIRDYNKLPSHFFSCMELRHLNLYACIFEPPSTFKGFGRLVSLELQDVQFTYYFKSFISNCPLLEHLVLRECTQISCLDINAPILKFLYYYGTYKSISFKNTPCLASVSIYETVGAYPLSSRKISDLIKVLSSLPA
ncbi:hypothetical protein P3X46_031261 [Hevea brasiliensis]|uniref:F-box domain-containing protein n=1 Tax=Hevea brasiliensis TaxID=3981 RepID=A0ABQ9KJR3_HEVBR|nr:F-box/FBD/LRR-repeat protein At1g13570 [Hevea brasiliensis]XP_021670896.2 F-box/FBD/LRR-repeat protein At1g13570 [Hevea brasiliensis]KAJ9140636.1 hypothetical protein P3X46_031261 [Hevea brasiliensis]